MAGCLHVVATPIGNLEDVTLRALRILREVELIAAEDTRRTAKLLQHYSISTRTTASTSTTSGRRSRRWWIGWRPASASPSSARRDSGRFGSGARLVAAALGRGIRVEAVPGPSAVLAALVSSGLTAVPFVFLDFHQLGRKTEESGFNPSLPSSGPSSCSKRLIVFWPHYVNWLNFGRKTYMRRRELTKLHEELVVGPINDVLGKIGQPRGELRWSLDQLTRWPVAH